MLIYLMLITVVFIFILFFTIKELVYKQIKDPTTLVLLNLFVYVIILITFAGLYSRCNILESKIKQTPDKYELVQEPLYKLKKE